MGDEACDLVAHALAGDDGHLINNALVGVEVKRQSRVVLLDDDSRRLLDSLRADTLCVSDVAEARCR